MLSKKGQPYRVAKQSTLGELGTVKNGEEWINCFGGKSREATYSGRQSSQVETLPGDGSRQFVHIDIETCLLEFLRKSQHPAFTPGQGNVQDTVVV